MKTSLRLNKIDEEQFLKMRSSILSKWSTGEEVDLEEAIDYQRNLPEHKRSLNVVEKLHEEGRSGLMPRTGTPLLEDQITICRTLVEAGVPIIILTFDTFTREGQYERVQQGIDESKRLSRATLNGFPMINLGVKNTRKIVESCECAFNTRVGWISGALGAEIALASGMSSLGNTGAFLLFGCYHKNEQLEDFIQHHQYIWRLMGYYAERGIIIPTDDHGWQPGFVFPYDVSIVCTILDSLMMATQGVKSIIPHIECQGNLCQDIAMVRVGRRLVREYLDRFGYKDVTVPGILTGQLPLYPVPQTMAESFAYSNYSIMIEAMTGAELANVRTLDEGLGVPSKEAHELSNRSANWVINTVCEQNMKLETNEIAFEEEITEKAIRAIVDNVLEIGDGDVVVGSIRAVEAGIIDSPFSPNIRVKDEVMGIRDSNGACRYLNFGNLPIPKEVKEFHREKVAEREKVERRKMSYSVAVEDFWAPSQGHLIGKPRA
jgi:methylaspartate mutase epsilon subunit